MGGNKIIQSKFFIKDVIIALVIIILPFLFFSYELIPETRIWENAIFTLESKYFNDVNYFVWIFNGKLMMIIFICLWFISCRHWWRNFILIPFLLEFYRFFWVIKC